MRIIFGSAFEPSRPGGAAVVVRTLGNTFREMGDDVAYLKPSDNAIGRAGVDKVPMYLVPMRWTTAADPMARRAKNALSYPVTAGLLGTLLARWRPHVVNVHYATHAWHHVFRFKRFFRFRLVVSVHGSDLWGPVGRTNLKFLESWADAIDGLVFCSNAFRHDVLTEDSPLYAKSRVVLNGIKPALFEVVPYRERRNVIVSVAHLQPRKAPEVLLNAFARIAGEFPGTDLEFVGEGPLRARLEERVRRANLTSRVRLLGVRSHEEALRLIASARIMALASRREPFGLVVAEAMQAATPVVATAVGGIPEIIRNGLDGMLVPPDNAIELAAVLRRVLTDEKLAESLGAAGRERYASCFTDRRFAGQYRELFTGLLAS